MDIDADLVADSDDLHRMRVEMQIALVVVASVGVGLTRLRGSIARRDGEELALALVVAQNEHLCNRSAHMGKAASHAGFAFVPLVLLRIYLALEKVHAVYTVRTLVVQLTWRHRPLVLLKHAQNRAYNNLQGWNAGHLDASVETRDRTRCQRFE